MKQIVFASGNAHKVAEVEKLLNRLLDEEISVLSLKDIGFQGDIEENGTTFEENALIKARAVIPFTQLPVISDDSGLTVDALDGRPGIYSARYASVNGHNSTDLENMELLLKNMSDKENRACSFVCAVAYIDADRNEYVRVGKVDGELLYAPEGEAGFGYDPIFYYKPFSKTFAQLTAEEKNKVSHRGEAIKLVAKIISER